MTKRRGVCNFNITRPYFYDIHPKKDIFDKFPYTFRSFIEFSFYHCPSISTLENVRNGPFLEMLGLGAMSRASFLRSISGTPFSKFFVELCNQLSLIPIIDAQLTQNALNVLGNSKNYFVPSCAPVNSSFSEIFQSTGFYTGTIISPKNKAEIDGPMLPNNLFTDELKNIACRNLTSTLIPEKNAQVFHPVNSYSNENLSEPSESPNAISDLELPTEDNDILIHIPEAQNTLEYGLSQLTQSLTINSIEKGLAITAEMKSHANPIDKDLLLSCCQKALKFKIKYLQSPAIKKHVHLVFVTKAKNWRLRQWSNRNVALNPEDLASKKRKASLAATKKLREMQICSDDDVTEDYRDCRVLLASFNPNDCTIDLQERIRTPKPLDDTITDVIVIPIETMFLYKLL